MKKHLFLIASVFTAFSLQAQTLTVAANTDVKVKSGTLFYIDGVVQVEKYTDTSKKVSNEGNFKITQKLVNKNETGANFVNEFVGTGNYGQLIVNSGNGANEGKISSGVKFNSGFNFQVIAIPYADITAGDFVKEAFGQRSVSSAFVSYTRRGKYQRNRYKNPLFYWNNKTYTLDELAENEQLNNPEREYAISTFSDLGKLKTDAVSLLSGRPVKDEISVEVTSYVPGSNKTTNKYGEYYGSYIVDFTLGKPKGWGDFNTKDDAQNTNNYGANIYHFGNPYTSNIDLSKGEGFTGNGVKAIYQASANNYIDGVAASAGAKYSSTMAATAQGAGDPAQFVRPFQPFLVKLESNARNHTFKFKNDMKTFELPENDKVNNILFARNSNHIDVINQLGLDLYDTNGFTGAKTYVVASDVYEAAQKGKGTEVCNIAMDDELTGIYTLQENEDGSINEELVNSKIYINGVNANKYVGKPIHLAFQNGKGKYTLKARLNESLEKNKNAFYFEDKVTGKVIKVEKDFEYSFDINGTDKDRFVLYWAATPNTKPVDEIVKEEANATVIYKDFNNYKVRFDKSIKNAEVFVYNISGQLINSAKSVDTSVDYIVPLKGNTGVYIVKVIGDNGKVITKKIIK